MKWKTAKKIVLFFDKKIIIGIDEEDQSEIYEVGDDIDKMKYTFNSVGILVKIWIYGTINVLFYPAHIIQSVIIDKST